MEKKILVTRSSMPEINEYVDMIRELWESHWLTNMGKYHQELTEKLEEFLDVPYVSLFTNGHMALELGIQAMKLHGEVITTPFTFVSTTHAIARNHLTPVFCDINDKDYTIDVNKIESLITDKTCAIAPVHVYGNICDVEALDQIAKKHNLKIIYDAAHAFGVRYKGKGIGAYGDISMFSFHATKVFNTIEGGAITCNDNKIMHNLYYLKNFGICSEEDIEEIGANAKMNEFQAAMGLCNLKHLSGEIMKRKRIVERYIERLQGIPGLQLPAVQKNVQPNYSYFPIVISPEKFGTTRDDVYNTLKSKNIFARKYFYPLTNTLECYRGKFFLNETPTALHISKRILTLPLYADLDLKDVDSICNAIFEIHSNNLKHC